MAALRVYAPHPREPAEVNVSAFPEIIEDEEAPEGPTLLPGSYVVVLDT